MFACEGFSDIDSGSLASALKVQQCTSVGEWVGDRNVGSIPAVAAVVGNIRVAAVVCIKAMGHRDWLPDSNLFAVPCLPWSAK